MGSTSRELAMTERSLLEEDFIKNLGWKIDIDIRSQGGDWHFKEKLLESGKGRPLAGESQF